MPNVCAVCSHRRVTEINADLDAGLSQGAVARKYNVGRASVGRHVRGEHGKPLPSQSGRDIAPTSVPTLGTAASPESLVRAIVDSLNKVDIDRLPVSQRMAVIRERRLAAEALAKHAPTAAVETDDAERVRALTDILAAEERAADAALSTLSPKAQDAFTKARAAALHILLPSTAVQQRPDWASAARVLGVDPEQVRLAHLGGGLQALAALARGSA